MRHIDLFSGIGGFSLACEWNGIETVGFVEIDPFCQKVLKKHWPEVKIVGDIHEVDEKTFQRPVDVITGGFPCQPFSVAGKRKGTDDDRYLWPAMLDVIKTYQPTWVIGENVAGIISMALEQVLSDLGNAGYETQAFVIPACAVNAPHRRDRVWVVAHLQGMDGKTSSEKKDHRQLQGCNESRGCFTETWLSTATKFCRVDARVSDRVDRLKSLGNAIVPQVAYEIIKAIKEANK